MDWSQEQVKLFRALLRCYPAEFRHEYGGEMEQVFGARLKNESRAGLWLEAIADIALSAPREHWHILAADVKYGLRVLAATPAFTALALLVIALGIGATVAVFSLANTVLFRSLPYVNPQNLVYLFSPNRNFGGVPDEMGPSVPDFYDWQRLARSFSHLALFRSSAENLVKEGHASGRVTAAFATGDFFGTLGAVPQVGRSFGAEEDQPGHEHLVVVSDRFSRSQFGEPAHALGRNIQLDRQTYKVIGVMPKDFGYPFNGDVPYEHLESTQTDIWVPAAYTPGQKTNRVNFDSADAIARLRPGVAASAAQAELGAIQNRIQPLYPAMWRGFGALVRPLIPTIVGPVEKMFWLLLSASALVLLIAISNVANLLLARAAARAHELGIRTALGAERSRVVRQLLTESLLLSMIGGALGIAFAYVAVHALVKLDPGGIPRFAAAQVDERALWVAVLLAVLAGLLSGLAPAISASKADVNHLLKKAGSRIAAGFGQTRFIFLAGEVALSVVLLTSAGLLIRSYLQLAAVNPGFSPATLTFNISVDERYNKPELRTAFYKDVLEKFRQMPGVRFAGAATGTPLTDSESVGFAEIQGFGKPKLMVENRSVTTGYRQAMGIPLLRGRDFAPSDLTSHYPVAIVNESFVAAYFRNRDPIGGRVRLGIGDFTSTPWSTVIGVIGNVRHLSLETAGQPQILMPVDNAEDFAIRCDRPVREVIAEARAALQSIDPVLSIEDIQTMGERMQTSGARRSFQTSLMAGFALAAVVLALAGLYALMSYTVRQRRAEIGVRLAIGSPRAAILGLILSQGIRVVALGLVTGVAISLAVSRSLSQWLFGVKAIDPLTYMVVSGLMLAVAAGACFIPAWSATKIDPVEALRAE